MSPRKTVPPGEHCPKCNQVHTKCAGHRRGKRPYEPCKAPPKEGFEVCRMHGGGTQGAKDKAAERLATMAAAQEVARLGLRIEVHPAEALLDLVHWTAGEVAYWRAQVVAIADGPDGSDNLTWGVTRVKEGGDDRGTTQEAKPHIAYAMLRDASDRLASYAAAALKAGVDERRVKLAEAQGVAVAGIQRAILERMFAAVLQLLRSHGIDDAKIITALEQAWAEAMGVIVPEELRRLTDGKEG